MPSSFCYQYLEDLKGSDFSCTALSFKYISLSLTLPVHHTTSMSAGMQEIQLKRKRHLNLTNIYTAAECEPFKGLKNVPYCWPTNFISNKFSNKNN